MNENRFIKLKFLSGMQSLMLVISMMLLLGLLGWLIGGAALALGTMVGVLLLFVFNPMMSPQLTMRLFRARPIAYSQARQLYETVEELTRRAKLAKRPALYYYPARIMNAFAVGTSENGGIAVSDGLLRNLSRREVVAVLAHELSHIGSNDTRVIGFAQLSNRLTNMLSLFGQLALILSLPAALMGGLSVSLIAILLLIAAPSLSLLLQMALSRTREYHADLQAARLTGDPQALASALFKMDQHNRHVVSRFLWPGYQRMPDAVMLRSHPPTRERIQRLREIDGHAWLPMHKDSNGWPVSADPRPARIVSANHRWAICGNGSCW